MNRFISRIIQLIGYMLGQLVAIIGIKTIAFMVIELFLLLIVYDKSELINIMLILQFPATLWVVKRTDNK